MFGLSDTENQIFFELSQADTKNASDNKRLTFNIDLISDTQENPLDDIINKRIADRHLNILKSKRR